VAGRAVPVHGVLVDMSAVDAGSGAGEVARLAGAIDHYDELVRRATLPEFDPVGLLDAMGEVCRASRAVVRTQHVDPPGPHGGSDA
jgi:hypothetical protein